jgi:hypothetical protein
VTNGSQSGPNAGGYDVFVRKYDGSGNLLWDRQLGSSADDGCCHAGVIGSLTFGATADETGSMYLASYTQGNLAGPNPEGKTVAFVAKYGANGNLDSLEQLGADEVGTGVSADGFGNVYFSGTRDPVNLVAFLAKFYDDPPVSPQGDFNTDGTVNAADYTVWRNGLGTTHTQADYDIWRAHFGQTASSAAHASVPEPSVVLLLPLAVLLAPHRLKARRL